MTELFDSIKIEVYNSSWVDITADVKSSPNPRWNRGIMSNRPNERVGYAGILTFTLNNSASNSAGLAGYYSPGHTNCWSGWDTGLKVRLGFTYESITYYKYYGRIKPDGIVVTPGSYSSRDVSVTCGDWMWLAGQHELKTLTFAQNKNAGETVTLVNANMPLSPLATSYATGVETFPSIFDLTNLKTTALAEYYRVAMSEWSYIYAKGDLTGGETLVVENQTTRSSSVASPVLPKATGECGFLILESTGDYLLKEDGDKLKLNQTQEAIFDNSMSEGMMVSYGKTMHNRVSSTAYPRRVDAAATTVLYELQKSFEIKAGETITGFRGSYRDPDNLASRVSGISMQALVAGTDYTATLNEDGSGGDEKGHLTITPAFGTEAVIYQIVSDAAHSVWIQTLRAVGKGVYSYDTIQSVQDDTGSQNIHGVVPLSLDFKYQADARKVQTFCSYVIAKEALPRQTVDACPIWANRDSLRMFGFLYLEPGTKATFKEAQTGIDADHFIMGYSAEIVNGKHVLWNPVLKDDPGYFVFEYWDVAKWDVAIWG